VRVNGNKITDWPQALALGYHITARALKTINDPNYPGMEIEEFASKVKHMC